MRQIDRQTGKQTGQHSDRQTSKQSGFITLASAEGLYHLTTLQQNYTTSFADRYVDILEPVSWRSRYEGLLWFPYVVHINHWRASKVNVALFGGVQI